MNEQNELSDIRRRVNQSAFDLTGALGSLDSFESRAMARISDLQTEVEKWKARLDVEQRGVEEAANRRKALHAEIAHLQEQRDKLAAEAATHEARRDQARSEIESILSAAS